MGTVWDKPILFTWANGEGKLLRKFLKEKGKVFAFRTIVNDCVRESASRAFGVESLPTLVLEDGRQVVGEERIRSWASA